MLESAYEYMCDIDATDTHAGRVHSGKSVDTHVGSLRLFDSDMRPIRDH